MRRRAKFEPHLSQPFDIMAELAPGQLKAIGAVCLVWNDIEEMLDASLAAASVISAELRYGVTSRIHGMDGKIALLRQAAKSDSLQKTSSLISNVLDAVSECKKYRDGVVHARIKSPDAIVAPTAQRRGISDETLISEDAIMALYRRLDSVRQEVWQMFLLLECDRTLKSPVWGTNLQAAVQQFEHSVLRLQEHQACRLALPPLPNFPTDQDSASVP